MKLQQHKDLKLTEMFLLGIILFLSFCAKMDLKWGFSGIFRSQ